MAAQKKIKLNVIDLQNLTKIDDKGHMRAVCPIALAFLDAGNYKEPSQERPDAHAKPLLTVRYARWLLDHFPDMAKQLKLTRKV